ncbi:MAG: Ku protein [Gemmatimonadetes bacterium]|nr:Ku protein [Gemmatimonadota bacterium]
MRSMWKGHISFGLVNIPVKLYSATSSEDLSFRFLHKKDNCPISYERVCEHDGKEVAWEDIVRGYEYEKGRFVVLTDEDFKRADVEATRTIDIVDFVDADEVDMMYFDKPYYLQPDKGGEKPYVLLRQALAATNRIGIAKVVIRTRQHLAAVKPKGDALVLNVMRFQNELVDVSELDLPGDADLDKREIGMAQQLIDNLTEPFDPARYTDDYREELLKVIHEKLEGVERPSAEERSSAQVIDIMSALKASLERTRRDAAGKGERDGGEGGKRSGGRARSRSGAKGRTRSGKAAGGGAERSAGSAAAKEGKAHGKGGEEKVRRAS